MDGETRWFQTEPSSGKGDAEQDNVQRIGKSVGGWGKGGGGRQETCRWSHQNGLYLDWYCKEVTFG